MAAENAAMTHAKLPTRGLFITGTDTAVGKTYVACLIARKLAQLGKRVGAYKPVCSGAEFDAHGSPHWQDAEDLSRAIGGADLDQVSPQKFVAPLAPPIAAAREGKTVDARQLRTGALPWLRTADILLVEGVGGLLCPIADGETVADFAADLGFPLLIVARLGLGTINHTLLTVEAARRRGLKIAGLILNEGSTPVSELEAETNPVEVTRLCDVPLLGVVRKDHAEPTLLGKAVDIDWWNLAAVGKPMS